MRKINGLFNEFETICLVEMSVANVSGRIYAELIDMGYIPSDFTDSNEIADICLVDLKHEFADEDVLAFLVYRIMMEAKIDVTGAKAEEEFIEDLDTDWDDEDYYDEDDDECDFECDGCTGCDDEEDEDEEELDEDDFVTPQYIVSVISMDFEEEEKETEVIPQIFTSLKEIADYVDMKGMVKSVESLMFGQDGEVGHTEMQSAEEAFNDFEEMGENGEAMADQIPSGASNIMAVITVTDNRTEMITADMYVIYDVTAE